jgi:hypothetical protein
MPKSQIKGSKPFKYQWFVAVLYFTAKEGSNATKTAFYYLGCSCSYRSNRGLNMYRFCFSLVVIWISLGSVSFAENSAEWVFVGYRIHTYAGPPKTLNKIPLEYGYTWLKKDKTYSKTKQNFKASIKSANEDAYVDFYLASPSSYKFVGIYKIRDSVGTWKGKEIEVTKYGIYRGKTKEQIQKKADSNRKEWKYLSSVPEKWVDLNSDRQKKSVSEILTRKARNQQGGDNQQNACHAAIAVATRIAEKECNVSKQGALINLISNKKKTAEYEIPAGQDKSVRRIQQCRSCEQSGQSGEWYCEAKVTVRCKYTSAVEDTGLINKLRGHFQGKPHTETDNPCVEDTRSKACIAYRNWKHKNRSLGLGERL